MRVLTVGNMYPPHHFGGYELSWRSAVEALRAGGHQVSVLTTDFRRSGVATEAERDICRDLRWYWRDHRFPRRSPAAVLRLERHNQRLLAQRLADVDAVAFWAMGGMSMALIEATRQAGVPALFVIEDEWPAYGPKVDAWQRSLARLPWRPARIAGVPARLERAGGRWIFISRYVEERAASAGWEPGQRRVARLGVDDRLFEPAPERPWQGRLLYVGRLDERKGIEVAIEALTSLPDCQLRVLGAGDDSYRLRLDGLVARLGLGSRVELESLPREQLPAAYAEADAVVFPSLWNEPQGIVPLEAMATGRPLIATGTGGSGEFLEHGRNCLTYEPADDPRALAAAIARLAAEPPLRERLRAGGLELAGELTETAFNRVVEAELEEAIADRR